SQDASRCDAWGYMNSKTSQPSGDRGNSIAKRSIGVLRLRFFQSNRAQRISRYVVAVLTILAATVLRLGLDPVLGEHHPFTLYFGAVAIASWYGDSGPGVLSFGFRIYFLLPSDPFRFLANTYER